MKKFWIGYLIVYLISEIICMVLLWRDGICFLSITDTLQIILSVGIIGLALQ